MLQQRCNTKVAICGHTCFAFRAACTGLLGLTIEAGHAQSFFCNGLYKTGRSWSMKWECDAALFAELKPFTASQGQHCCQISRQPVPLYLLEDHGTSLVWVLASCLNASAQDSRRTLPDEHCTPCVPVKQLASHSGILCASIHQLACAVGAGYPNMSQRYHV